ncbi:hypothetical protein [Saccharibacillus sp. JS10]|nr:hypothetical protein [Saccharibacillus sp. JS10]
MMYHMWVRHHLRPGEFWNLPRGERLMLLAFSEEELEALSDNN